MKIAVVGGDDRQCCAARVLQKAGHSVCTWALDASGVCSEASVEKALDKAGVLLLPLPASRHAGFINAPRFEGDIGIDEVIACAGESTLVLAGLPDEHLRRVCDSKGLRLIDYGLREEIAADGAVSTAEAAVAIIVQATSSTIAGSDILVIGAGRIGTRLAQMLHALGARVTVSARKKGDLTRISAQGMKAVNTANIGAIAGEYDVVVNTVPSQVLGGEEINRLKIGCFLLDLASAPGGFDRAAVEKARINYNWALGLPGKTAPDSAGRSVAKTVLNIIEEIEGGL